MTMQEETTIEAVVSAWRDLIRRGDRPSVRRVHAEMRRRRGAAASMRDIVPVVARLRAESEADPRVDEVIRLLNSLDPVALREAMRRIRSEVQA